MSIEFGPSGMTLDALRSVPLFASLDDTAARHLRSLLLVRNVKSDSAIFRTGDAGDSLCLIESRRLRTRAWRCCRERTFSALFEVVPMWQWR